MSGPASPNKETAMTDFVARMKAFTGETWDAYIHHPWIEAMLQGNLGEDRLRFFLLQDLPYLADYERIYHTIFAGLTLEQHRSFRPFIKIIADFDEGRAETDILQKLGCNEFPHDHWSALPAREGYKNHLVRLSYERGPLQTLVGMLPCSVGFTEIGARFVGLDISGFHPAAQMWIELYRRPFQAEHVDALLDGLLPEVAKLDEASLQEMERIFLRSTQHQINVFDAAWRMKDEWPGAGSWSRGT